jgi:flagellar basal-body rod modification protein FlgD
MEAIAATTPGPTTTGSRSAGSSGTLVESDFQTFLVMLTTQMQNQDPLNPIDSTDYASQLATFSGVEQQVKTNQLLESLSTQMGLSGMAQLASWVGMEARVDAPAMFSSTPLTLFPTPAPDADQAVLVVYDAQNREVGRTQSPVSRDALTWAGTDASGNPFAPGTYSFRLESYRAGELVAISNVEVFGRIAEVRSGSDGAVLVMEGGAEVAPAQITSLRNAALP